MVAVQVGRQRGAGMLSPAPLLLGTDSESPQQLLVKEEGKRESFGKEGELVEVTLMLYFP